MPRKETKIALDYIAINFEPANTYQNSALSPFH